MTHVLFLRRLRPDLLSLAMLLLGGGLAAQQNAPNPPLPPPPNPLPPAGEWQSLFDGKTLKGWKETPFSARGKVTIQDGTLVLGTGAMTGVTWTDWFPRGNYEVRMEAMRVSGYDFFAGITFPVGDSYLTWINGGWGGRLVGISSLDGEDASENETGQVVAFENGRWYRLLLRVAENAVQAWIDGEKIIGVDLTGRELSLRPGEIELSVPFGIATYSTAGALRNIEYRLLPAEGAAQP
jgi:hypothetical protein